MKKVDFDRMVITDAYALDTTDNEGNPIVRYSLRADQKATAKYINSGSDKQSNPVYLAGLAKPAKVIEKNLIAFLPIGTEVEGIVLDVSTPEAKQAVIDWGNNVLLPSIIANTKCEPRIVTEMSFDIFDIMTDQQHSWFEKRKLSLTPEEFKAEFDAFCDKRIVKDGETKQPKATLNGHPLFWSKFVDFHSERKDLLDMREESAIRMGLNVDDENVTLNVTRSADVDVTAPNSVTDLMNQKDK